MQRFLEECPQLLIFSLHLLSLLLHSGKLLRHSFFVCALAFQLAQARCLQGVLAKSANTAQSMTLCRPISEIRTFQ